MPISEQGIDGQTSNVRFRQSDNNSANNKL